MNKEIIYKKFRPFREIIFLIMAVFLVNYLVSFTHLRWDWSSEKRYTLSEESRAILDQIQNEVEFKVYLEGDFPAGFMRLKQQTRNMLDEFRSYNKKIHYEFINLYAVSSINERNEMIEELIELGLNQTNLQVKTSEGMEQQMIFPGAIVRYQDKQLPMDLLQPQMGIPPETVLNNSMQSLEYQIANTLMRLIRENKPQLAFLLGHGELNGSYMADIHASLAKDYQQREIEISGNPESLISDYSTDSAQVKYSALIIAKPLTVFSEADKFVIDQYLMLGGRVLWLIDPVVASMDSLRNHQSIMAITRYLNLDDQLFTYGVRLNNNLLMDMNAQQIALRTGQIGDQPQIEFFPWYYYPVIYPQAVHPIVKNLNKLSTEFVSSIDTLPKAGIHKTILLSSSNLTRSISTPAIVSFDILRSEPPPSFFNQKAQAIAVLLEGEFESVFKNRNLPLDSEYQAIKVQTKSVKTQMIIVSDGDFIKNQLQISQSYPLPLGYDQFTGQTYGNKDFILNAVNYLTGGEGIIALRNREFKLRLLDKEKIATHRLFWQLINGILPIALIIFFGLILQYLRYRKYGR